MQKFKQLKAIIKKKFPICVLIYRRYHWLYRRYLKTLYINIYKYRVFSFNPNVKGYWNQKLSKINDFWRNENYYHILELFPHDSMFSLLDVGCAIGDGCELLQKKFPKAKITGIDISDIGIKKAKQKTKRVNYFVLNILKDPLTDIYDHIIVIETLEHFDNPFFIINKLLKHAKKSVIISVPYSPKFTGKIAGMEHRYAFNENTFSNSRYNYRIFKITDFIKATKSKCIIYEIFSNVRYKNKKVNR